MFNIRSAIKTRPAFYFTIAVYLILNACANPVMPTGGPKDTTPPKILKSNPRDRSTNFKSNKIEIEFNEYVKLNTGNNKILVSPPMKEAPEYKLSGKKLIIELKEKLIDSLTYSFFFTDAIQDITEGNPLEPFSYVFSTGPHIDSLVLSGSQVSAMTGKPEEGVFVGLWPAQDSIHPSDSLPLLTPPRYLAVASKEGIWEIQNVAKGKYQLLAFKDINSSFTYDRFAEIVGYPDSLVEPFYVAPPKKQQNDTSNIDTTRTTNVKVFNDSTSTLQSNINTPSSDTVSPADSLHPKKEIEKLQKPSSVVNNTPYTASKNDSITENLVPVVYPKVDLTLFQEIDSTQRFLGFNLIRSNQGQLCWRMPLKEPSLEFQPSLKSELIYKWSNNRDTLAIWLPNQNADSVKLIIKDKRNVSDTINKSWTIQPPTNRKSKKPVVETLKISLLTESGKTRYYQPFTFTFDQPVRLIEKDSAILLYSSKDTTQLAFHKIDSLGMIWQSAILPEPISSYRIVIKDSTFVSVLGMKNKKEDLSISTSGPESYGQLILNLENFQKGNWFFELLDEKDKKIKTIFPDDKKMLISKLLPAKYRIRAIFDKNKNRIWDPGEYFSKRQAEPVIYYPQVIEIRANWDVEEQWSLPNFN